MEPVHDDPDNPDPRFADLYASLPEPPSPEPWLSWARAAGGPVLYLGIGSARIAAPLEREGVDLVGVDSHPGMLEFARARLRGAELVRSRIEDLDLRRTFELVIVPSNILCTPRRLERAAAHLAAGGRLGFQLMNPHWLRAGASPGVSVREMTSGEARIEVTYPGGIVQEAAVPLVWPEEIESFLGPAGLRLLRLAGEPEAELAESPTFYVLASKRLRRAQIPST